MCVEKCERYKEESRRSDEFEAAQVECFREVHEQLTIQDNNFKKIVSYAIEQFNEIRQNMASNETTTQAGIRDMIHYQNKNHHHYILFYSEMCSLWDFEYGVKGASWFRGRGRGRGQGRGHGH